jgi:predicted phosphoadenosine phosphosulfate sulfurtransferase
MLVDFYGVEPAFPLATHLITRLHQLMRLSFLLLLLLQMLVEFYGVEAAFPLATHLITRSLEAAFPKRLYYVSMLAAALTATCQDHIQFYWSCWDHFQQ